MIKYKNFTEAYYDLVRSVYTDFEHLSAPRGLKNLEKLGYSFRIENIRDRIPFMAPRKFSMTYMIAELVWYLSGNDSTEWIANYSSFWRNISDDGKTANSAYGARIFKPHDRIAGNIHPVWTQWNYVLSELRSDPDSRRAVIHIRSPHDSILAAKDVPCTLALQFFIRDNKLHQVASMRSSDLILGIAYDVPAFTTFQELLAVELGVECGHYTHVSNSLHIYERHFDMCEEILAEASYERMQACGPMPDMPKGGIPMTFLDAAETLARGSETEQQLLGVIDDIMLTDVDPYWKDWALILAWHRANKLKLDDLCTKIMSLVKYEGYKVFNR